MGKDFLNKTRTIFPVRQDEYESTGKFPDATVCIECGNVYKNGRWIHPDAQIGSAFGQTKCPACRRLEDHRPAGDITIKGPFTQQHHDEIMGRIRRIERKERARHPIEKIIGIVDEPYQTDITTSGIHLARRIGDALHHSFKGDLSYSYGRGEKSIQVHWER